MTVPNVPGKEEWAKSLQVKASAFGKSNKKNVFVIAQESAKILAPLGSYSGGFAE